jgi:hypothetical protein
MGKDDLVADLTEARDDERDHLLKIRSWVTAAVSRQAGVDDAPHEDAAASAPPA